MSRSSMSAVGGKILEASPGAFGVTVAALNWSRAGAANVVFLEPSWRPLVAPSGHAAGA